MCEVKREKKGPNRTENRKESAHLLPEIHLFWIMCVVFFSVFSLGIESCHVLDI